MNILTLLKQIGSLVLILFLSWILIHFLALFGIFLALAIPLLHLVFYPHIICFWCRLKGTKHTSAHSLIDSALILVLTAISIPLVLVEYSLIHKITSQVEIAQVAQFTIPKKSQHPVGVTFPFAIELMNIPSAINVVQADISFDPSIVEVVDISLTNTFAEFIVQKEFDNSQGYIRVSGGIPNPGFREPTGLLATVYLRGKKPGAIKLQYLESSLVLANDGRGTNLLADLPSIPFIITPGAVSTEPVQIFDQVQGEKSHTVLSFSEYAMDLPSPYPSSLGLIMPSTVESIDPSNIPSSNLLLSIDRSILRFWSLLSR